jgi:carbonic anhydrase
MSSEDPVVQGLLENNKKWAKAVVEADPDFFVRSAEGQSPQVLWIGCSDSRVPGAVVTASKPGDIFLHRNIANQVHLHDDNVLSVVDYAVAHLKVKHVIVVGHSECGGAKHCLEAAQDPCPPPQDTPLHRWLEPLTNLARSLGLGSDPPPEGALSILVKENVIRQVQNLTETETIKHAWDECKDVWIHGLVYDLSTGLLGEPVVTISRPVN